jgi:hypothetical protein
VEMLGKAAAVEVDGFAVDRLNGKPLSVDGHDYAAVSRHAWPRGTGFVN